MRRAAIAVPALLAACAAAPPTPIRGETPGHTCQATGTDQFIGKPGTSVTGAAILRATKAAVIRWASPGAMLTMDYRADRVTVRLGPDRRVTQISCG